VQEGNHTSPGELILLVATGASEPECFLTARTNSVTAIPKIELIHSMGTHALVLGQADDLHGHAFAFVGDQVGNQLPSTFLEPAGGGALVAFETINVEASSEADVNNAHHAQANAPLFLVPSNAVGVDTDLMEVCMISLKCGHHASSQVVP
jgi:hypothetical protein